MDELRVAETRFLEGERAFRAGDPRRAAEAFEAAYEIVPHIDALWNAARSWQAAAELARAANLYARYLREAPATARDRNSATIALARLAPTLGALEIVAVGFDVVEVDQKRTDVGLVYVHPGVHVVRATNQGREVVQTPRVERGQIVSVAFAPEESIPKPAERPIDSAPKPAERPIAPTTSQGWTPWVLVVEGALTLVASGLTVASALDTRHARDAFFDAPTEQNLDSGRAKQTRTNVLLGVSSALGVVTAATAIWLVDWHSQSPTRASGASLRIGVAPSGLDARGTF